MKNIILKLCFCLPLILVGITFLFIGKIFTAIICIILSGVVYIILEKATNTQSKKIIKWILSFIGILFLLGLLGQILPNILGGTVQTGYIIIVILVVFFVNIFWGAICEYVAKNKGYSKNFFWLGFFLWFIGLIILGCMRDNTLKQNINFSSSIEQLVQLREKGMITQAEFEESKKKILNKL